MDLKSVIKKFSKETSSSFKYAYNGLLSSIKTERNMRIHIFIMFLVIIAGIIFNISLWEWIICLILFGAVISSELFNTAFEIVVDLIMPYKNEKAKLAKDIAASAVLIWAIISAIIGLIIFIPKVIQLLS
jgi:diacylglycerol kinase (ATP)